MLEDDLCVELKDAETAVALTEEKCAAMTCGISEMMELEAKEKDRVSHVVCIWIFNETTVLYVNGHFQQIFELSLQIEDEIKRIRKSEARLSALQEDVNKNVSMVILLTSHYNTDCIHA